MPSRAKTRNRTSVRRKVSRRNRKHSRKTSKRKSLMGSLRRSGSRAWNWTSDKAKKTLKWIGENPIKTSLIMDPINRGIANKLTGGSFIEGVNKAPIIRLSKTIFNFAKNKYKDRNNVYTKVGVFPIVTSAGMYEDSSGNTTVKFIIKDGITNYTGIVYDDYHLITNFLKKLKLPTSSNNFYYLDDGNYDRNYVPIHKNITKTFTQDDEINESEDENLFVIRRNRELEYTPVSGP